MKVLFISNDKAIFEEGSPVRARMREYARAIGSLHIIGRSKCRVALHDGPLVLHGYPLGALGAFVFFPGIARTLIKAEGIEIVSAQDPFEYGHVALAAVEGTGAKLHVQIHTDVFSPWFVRGSLLTRMVNRLRRTLADRVLQRADAIRVVSVRIKESLSQRYDNLAPISILPIPPSLSLPQKVDLPPHPFSFTFVALSRFEEEKRIPDLFRALFRVQRRYPHTGLLLIGEGRLLQRLRREARTCCRPGSVLFLPWRADALSLLQSAQAFAQASAYEGYGRTLIEAALAGVPIVSTNVGIVGEVLVPEADVLASEPGDVAGLANNMERLIEDERLRVMLPMSAKAKARAHVTSFEPQPERIAEDLARTLTGASRQR